MNSIEIIRETLLSIMLLSGFSGFFPHFTHDCFLVKEFHAIVFFYVFILTLTSTVVINSFLSLDFIVWIWLKKFQIGFSDHCSGKWSFICLFPVLFWAIFFFTCFTFDPSMAEFSYGIVLFKYRTLSWSWVSLRQASLLCNFLILTTCSYMLEWVSTLADGQSNA